MDDDLAPGDQQEDGTDFASDSTAGLTEAVVTATDWTTQTVLSQLGKGNIELNPAFQRRDAWNVGRKSRFIESLILGIPIPQLVLAERRNRRNSFVVIDGKQRLLALRQFCASQSDPEYKNYTLRGLDIRSDLNGIGYELIDVDERYRQDITNFENQPIRTVVIRNWPNEKFLYQVFLRLNTGSVPLSPQELRQALHPGAFSTFVDNFSADSEAIRRILGLTAPDFRMRDAELVIRYFSFRNFLSDYKGNLAPLFDSTTEKLNHHWARDERIIKDQAGQLTSAIGATEEIFGKNAFRKWNGTSYERPLNRAVFDVMVLFFDKLSIRNAALQKKDDVQSVFKKLCESDSEFRSAIEGTTKSIEAIYTRLSHWARKLDEAVGPGVVSTPALVDNRIVL